MLPKKIKEKATCLAWEAIVALPSTLISFQLHTAGESGDSAEMHSVSSNPLPLIINSLTSTKLVMILSFYFSEKISNVWPCTGTTSHTCLIQEFSYRAVVEVMDVYLPCHSLMCECKQFFCVGPRLPVINSLLIFSSQGNYHFFVMPTYSNPFLCVGFMGWLK